VPRPRKPKEPVQRFQLSDGLWQRFEPLLPKRAKPSPMGGRPPADLRILADAIFKVLRTGCQWKSLTRRGDGCSGSVAHKYFQLWVNAGVFEKFWKAGLHEYDEVKGIDWKWQTMDGAMTKAPLGEARSAPTRPTARKLVPRGRFRQTGWASR